MGLDDLLTTVHYVVDDESHIHVDVRRCAACSHQNCALCCPAGCFEADGTNMRFRYHGCLECGACRIVCDQGAITWGYPRGGYGVAFCFG